MSESVRLQVVGDSGEPHRDGRGRLGAADWRLRVSGAVGNLCTLGLDELWSLPMEDWEVDVRCVSRGRICELPPGQRSARFRGVELRRVLELARPGAGVRTVRFVSRAGGACGPAHEPHDTSLEYATCLREGEVLLAGWLNGQPLPYCNGGPLRSVVRSRYFYKSVKWLGEVELLQAPPDDCRGTWERYAGYHNVGLKYGPRFEPFLKLAADDGSLLPVPPGERRAVFESLLRAGDLSRLVAARLQDTEVGVFQAAPGWRAGLRFASGFDGRTTPLDPRGTPCFKAALRGTVFDGQDLRGWDLAHANFSLSRFTGARLGGANLSGCDLEGATFWRADLSGASLRGASLGGVEFFKTSARGRLADAARVEGLDATGAVGLRPEVAAWLRAHGAKVDDSATK